MERGNARALVLQLLDKSRESHVDLQSAGRKADGDEEMTDDLVEQLRLEKREITWRAADEIERLRADCAKLETSHGQLQKVIDGLTAELAVERERAEAATHYATQITVWTVETFFEPDKTGWKPLTELLGVLSQLDNALVGVREKRDKLREALVRTKEVLRRAGNYYCEYQEDIDVIDAVLKETE